MEIDFSSMIERLKAKSEEKRSFHYRLAWLPTFVYDRKLIWLSWYAAYKQIGGCGAYGMGNCWHRYSLKNVAEDKDGNLYLYSDINRV